VSDPFARTFLEALATAASGLGYPRPDGAERLARRFGVAGFVRRHRGARTSAHPDPSRVLVDMFAQVLLEAARDISERLDANRVPHCFVKGVALVGRVYRPGDREMVDIDLHVHPDARQRALEVLELLGYAPLPSAEQDGPSALRAGVALESASGRAEVEHVALDVRWGVDPVDRLLPRPDLTLPDVIWQSIDRSGPLPVPADPHHAALIVHHLVHHDLLHARGLLDLALLWRRLPEEASGPLLELAGCLGVTRATRLIGEMLSQHFALSQLALGPVPQDWRARRARRLLQPVPWLTWAGAASDAEHAMITRSRVARRVLLLDDGWAGFRALRDAVVPPRPYLRWRWPQSSGMGALLKHLNRVTLKLLRHSAS
jgi:hypothetical protein